MIPTYDDALRQILGLPALEGESWGARRVVQCLFKPSFHAECAVSLVERRGATSLTVRVPARPVWALVGAREGAATGDPAADWLTPGVSVEHVAAMPPEVAAAWGADADALSGARLPPRNDIGLDGLSVDVRLWSPQLHAAFGLWFGPVDEADARHRLVRAVLRAADATARSAESTAALRNVAAYLEDGPSPPR